MPSRSATFKTSIIARRLVLSSSAASSWLRVKIREDDGPGVIEDVIEPTATNPAKSVKGCKEKEKVSKRTKVGL
jgi:hypothetical protein